MKKQTTRANLRELLTKHYVPLVFAAGFSGPNKISGNKLSHDFMRKVGEETHHLSIMFEKWQRPRFVVDLAIEPPGGYEPIIVNGGEVIQGRLTPVPGPTTRSWFRADPPWWKRMIFPHAPTRENDAVEECMRFWPEVEAWWAIRSDSEHIRLHTVRYPGTLTTKGYLGHAQERARRRRSPWNLILIPFGILGVFGVSIGLFSFLWYLNTWVYPEHTGRLQDMMGSKGHQASQLLMTLPCFIAGIPLGLLLANCMAWCIPPGRRIFEFEAKGVAHASFRTSMSDLGKFALFIVPVCMVLSIIGALILR